MGRGYNRVAEADFEMNNSIQGDVKSISELR